MMKNLILFAIFAVSSELMLANTVFALPGFSNRADKKVVCPRINKFTATLLPHESDCTLYYICESGEAIERNCPDNLHFNPKKRVCDFPERAGCDDGKQEEVFLSAGFPHSDCPSKDPNEPVILPHESDCSKFYICRSGLGYEKTCPFDLHFNPKLRVCDYPENAKCAHRFSVKADQEPKCPRINKHVATLLPHETDCTQYYMCESGEPILRYCPDGLHFNSKKNVCDFPERAGCNKDDKGESHIQLAAPEATGSPSPFCPTINGKQPIYFIHPTNCSIFYQCGNGLAYEFACPSGLHFNIRQKVCDYPRRAKCPNEGF